MEKKKQYKPNTCVSTYEFMEKFPNEETAIVYIENLRWQNGIVCPLCGSHEIIRNDTKHQHWCKKCRNHFSVRVNTIFHSSHIKLHKWLYAIYLVMTSRKGISSMQLSKEIGVTQKSAWYLQQRIREAFTEGDDSFLRGVVEIDESFFGGKNENRHAIKQLPAAVARDNKIKVVGARERGTGRVKSAVVGNVTGATLCDFTRSTVEQDSVICTDEAAGYNGLNDDYTHKTVNHSAKEYVDGMAYTNGIESFWAVLKRGFYGIHHWFSEKHAQRYVNEFAFRVYEGSCDRHSYDRMDSALTYFFLHRTTYRQIIDA